MKAQPPEGLAAVPMVPKCSTKPLLRILKRRLFKDDWQVCHAQ